MIATAAFREALTRGSCISVIAEFKRRSPSAGALAESEDITDVAASYLAHGAAAMSVLTDPQRFLGHVADLVAVNERMPALPLLRKDFITTPDQIVEARRAGASAVLLIVRYLPGDQLRELQTVAREQELDALVEVHDEAELEHALLADAQIIGINNRNLETLQTDIATTERLAARVPDGITVVSESGLRTAADVARMRDAGAHAVLIGEALLRLPPVKRVQLLTELTSVPR